MKTFSKKRAALCAAVAALAFAGNEQAYAQALDLTNPTARMVNVEIMTGSGEFGPKLPAALTVAGGMATLTIAADSAPPDVPTFDPMPTQAGGTVQFANDRFSSVLDRTISIDIASGDTRIEQTGMGMIDFNVDVMGFMISQPLMFNAALVSATDLGPLFSADTVPNPNAGGAASGAPLTIQGSGRACAMSGSAFLAPEIAVPQCTPETFANVMQLAPTPFARQTGTVTTVGFTAIQIQTFEVMGAGVTVTVTPVLQADRTTLRLTEIGP